MGFLSSSTTQISAATGGDLIERLEVNSNVRQVVAPVPPSWKPLRQFLDLNGDGSGTTNIAGADYTSVNDEFYIQPAAGEIYHINALVWMLAGASMSYSKLGAATAPSTSDGLQLYVHNGSTASHIIGDPTNSQEIRTTAELDALSDDPNTYAAHGITIFRSVMDFGRHGGAILLSGDDTERLAVNARGDYSGNALFYVTALGHRLVAA